MRLLPLFLIVLVLLSVSACDSAEGPPGPPGYDGNANVRSVNFTFRPIDATLNDAGDVISSQYDVPGITRSVVQDGAVLVFFREFGTWTAMPFTFGVESPDMPAVDYTVTIGYGFDEKFLEVFYEASTGEIDLREQPEREMKAVIIDGFPASKAGIDLTDYEQVKAYYGLED